MFKSEVVTNLISNVLSGDNGKLLMTIGGILSAYAINEYFNTARKAMENDYNATMNIDDGNSLSFCKNAGTLLEVQSTTKPNIVEISKNA